MRAAVKRSLQVRRRRHPNQAVSAPHSAWSKRATFFFSRHSPSCLCSYGSAGLWHEMSWSKTRVPNIPASLQISLLVNGYVGLMGGPQLVDPPLYPMLIRAGLFFTHSAVASARAVSIAP